MIFCIISTIVTAHGSLVKCPACRGTGSIRHHSYCPGCLGRGTRETEIPERVEVTCGGCGGTGRQWRPDAEPCWTCGGRGTREEPVVRRESHSCLDCGGQPVTTWSTECELCDGSGRIPVELRRRLRKKRIVRALVKLAIFLAVIYTLLCALVYFTERL
jgi:DnaJ-class molecular chaperone